MRGKFHRFLTVFFIALTALFIILSLFFPYPPPHFPLHPSFSYSSTFHPLLLSPSSFLSYAQIHTAYKFLLVLYLAKNYDEITEGGAKNEMSSFNFST
jgi:hypothetical protein